MARFIFTLEPVLEHRIAIEREKQRAVADLERERARYEERLAEIRATANIERDDLREALSANEYTIGGAPIAVDLTRVKLQAHAGFRCATEERRLILALAGVLERLSRSRKVLLDATTRRKGVELLKTKQRAAYLKEESRKQDALLDEIAVMRVRTRGSMP